jgi:CBS domain-containing protein
MHVSEVLHKNKTLITVKPTTVIKDLWKIIFSNHINSVVVVDNNKKLIGIVAKDDLLSMLYPKYNEFIADFESSADFEAMEREVINIGRIPVSDIMCKKVVYTRHDTLLMRALSRMIVHHVDQLPVLSENDQVIGILTKGDIFYALFKNKIQNQELDVRQTENKQIKIHKSQKRKSKIIK